MNSNTDAFILSKEDATSIFKKSTAFNQDAIFKSYNLCKASEKMLGFLSDYWKLEIQFTAGNKRIQFISFFIKCVSQTNESKAKFARDLKLFDKEGYFYAVIREKINIPEYPAWSANLIMTLNEAMVLEDLNYLHYKTRNKHATFDKLHTFQALQALARFHAGSLIYEEKTRKKLNNNFVINDEHKTHLNRGGYVMSDPWFTQCMVGASEAIKCFSKYRNDKEILREIDNKWAKVWESALDLSHFSHEHRNVICHRDLWNNNILFRYKEVNGKFVPDNCVLVDFQAVTCQPPAGDVMMLLHCNLDHKFLERHKITFLNYYYGELKDILASNEVALADIMSSKEFLISCEKYKLWGLVVTACLVPHFWVDDDLTLKYFSDEDSYGEIMMNNKGSFIKKMMASNEDYKDKVMQVFEEIVDIYCLDRNVHA